MGNQQGSSSFYMERGKPSTVMYPSSLGSGGHLQRLRKEVFLFWKDDDMTYPYRKL